MLDDLEVVVAVALEMCGVLGEEVVLVVLVEFGQRLLREHRFLVEGVGELFF